MVVTSLRRYKIQFLIILGTQKRIWQWGT